MTSDSYWEPRGGSWEDYLESAKRDADMLVSEWAEFAEVEVSIDVRSGSTPDETLFTLLSIRKDGAPLYTHEPGDYEVFDHIEDLRDFVEMIVPLPDDAS